MSVAEPSLDLDALLPAIETAVNEGSVPLNTGNQGAVHLIEIGGHPFPVHG